MDPLEFRLKNARQGGHAPRRRAGLSRASAWSRRVEAAKKHRRTTKLRRSEGTNRGRGVARGFWFNVGLQVERAPPASTPTARSTWSKARPTSAARAPRIAMQLAETLGIRAEDVKPDVVDTDIGRLHRRHRRQPRDLRHRLAAYEAAQDIKRQMIERRRAVWERARRRTSTTRTARCAARATTASG